MGRRVLGEPCELGEEAGDPVVHVADLHAEGVGHGQVEAGGHVAERRGLGGEVGDAPLGARGREHDPQGGVGQVPGVGGTQHVLAHDGQVGAIAPQRRQLGHHVGEAALAQHPGHLDVGVGLVVDPAEQLEDQPLVVDDRRVRLLDEQRAGDPGLLVGGDGPEDGERQRGVDQGVVQHEAVELADRDPALAVHEVGLVGGGPAAQHDLVRRVGPVGGRHVDQQPRQQRDALFRVAGAQLDHAHVDARRGLVTGEPTLAGHELGQ